MTKNEAIAANTAASNNARIRIQVVRTPLRFADRTSKPAERSWRPEPLAWSQ